jgi:fructan beta-fructosidase
VPSTDSYRPQYHFSPPANWANDPNGLVYYQGEYHLFYQYHPNSTDWGPMHWGHAVSRDLINWEHLPIALYPDDNGMIFSGSAVIDWQNTAGFGKEAMVAIFTHDKGGEQSQSLAYSNDLGRTWVKFSGNPVISPPENIRDFRDPKVFWNFDNWVMCLAAGKAILFYTSPDLKVWSLSGSFGNGFGATNGIWETPDLFQLPVGDSTCWVLTVGVGDGAPAGGPGTQYFIGQFDGGAFISQNPKETTLWADFGTDYYAAQSWSDEPAGRRIMIGWQNNWRYASAIPTSTWRSAFSLPRELSLATTPPGIRLIQQPIPEVQQLRGQHWNWQNTTLPTNSDWLKDVKGETLEIIAEFQMPADANVDRFGICVRVGNGESTTIGYAPKHRTLFVDRSRSGRVDFSPNFRGVTLASLEPIDDVVRLHIFVDRSSVEVFGNDGRVVMTDQIFPALDSQGLEVFVENGQVLLRSLDIYSLHAAQFQVPAENQINDELIKVLSS